MNQETSNDTSKLNGHQNGGQKSLQEISEKIKANTKQVLDKKRKQEMLKQSNAEQFIERPKKKLKKEK